MKTLYISDLDGTLLNKKMELSEYTTNTLNKLISRGASFSVATARSSVSTDIILEDVNINLPVILMNGVLVYNMQSKKYVKKEMLSTDKVTQILTAMRKAKLTGLMNALSGEKLVTYYESAYNDALRIFIGEREFKYNKKFVQIDDLCTADLLESVFYFCYMDTHENIGRLHGEVAKISGLRIEMYHDIYSNGDLWYLEIFSGTASKFNAVLELKKMFGFDRIVSFGDNLNDLPLFRASDECYAVANAKDEVKAAATAVIGSNEDDGVARWLDKIIEG